MWGISPTPKTVHPIGRPKIARAQNRFRSRNITLRKSRHFPFHNQKQLGPSSRGSTQQGVSRALLLPSDEHTLSRRSCREARTATIRSAATKTHLQTESWPLEEIAPPSSTALMSFATRTVANGSGAATISLDNLPQQGATVTLRCLPSHSGFSLTSPQLSSPLGESRGFQRGMGFKPFAMTPFSG